MRIGQVYLHGLGHEIGADRARVEMMERVIQEWWTFGLGRSGSYCPQGFGSGGGSSDPDELAWSMQRVESAFKVCSFIHLRAILFQKELRRALDYYPTESPSFGRQFKDFAEVLSKELQDNPRPKYFEEA